MAKKTTIDKRLIDQARNILQQLGMPGKQINDRTAICLLAALNVTEFNGWQNARAQLFGIRAVLDFARLHTEHEYAENTRETVRDESIKPMVAAGILVHNPDDPSRKVNSPKTVYSVSNEALELIKTYGTHMWETTLSQFLNMNRSLVNRYARRRQLHRVPLTIESGATVSLSPGEHSELIKQILETFCPQFVPGAEIVYVGDTEQKWGAFFNRTLAQKIGVQTNAHGQMPDVIVYHRAREWLVCIEAVISNGPIDDRRRDELTNLFGSAQVSLVFVTAFLTRAAMRKYLVEMAWESEVWCADAPSHLIHFNGTKFLGPY